MTFILEKLRAFLHPLVALRAHWLYQRHPIFRFELRRTSGLEAAGVKMDRPALRVPAALRDRRIALGIIALLAAFAVLVRGGAWFIVSLSLHVVISAGGLAIGFFVLFVILPFIPWLWRIPTVLLSAVPIARERERRRWLILRSTLYSTRDILHALHAASTYRVLTLWTYITGIRLMIGILLLVPLAVAVLGELFSLLHNITPEMPLLLTLFNWLAYLLSFLYFLAEPYLDIATDGALGLLASTLSTRPLLAMLAGLTLQVSLEMLRVAVMLLVLDSPAALAALGPGYGLWFGLPPEIAAVTVLVWTGLRVAFLHGVFWLTQRRIETMG